MTFPVPDECPNASQVRMERVVADLTRFVSDFKEQHNLPLNLADSTLEILENWNFTLDTQDFVCLGPTDASVVVVDSSGCFFNGPAGELMENILKAVKLLPEKVFVCNAQDRKRIMACIDRIKPRVIILFGQEAACTVLGKKDPIQRLQGRFHDVQKTRAMVTLHPEALLEDPGQKRLVWEDMKKVMALLEQ